MKKEIWQEIPAYEKYEVSDMGRVRNKSTGLVLSQWTNQDGYKILTLRKEKGVSTLRVNRLVASAFLGELFPHLVVDHINHVRDDNTLSNLRFFTYSQNAQHSLPRRYNTRIYKPKGDSHHINYVKDEKRNNNYLVRFFINKKRIGKFFKSFEEAVIYRDKTLSTIKLTQRWYSY